MTVGDTGFSTSLTIVFVRVARRSRAKAKLLKYLIILGHSGLANKIPLVRFFFPSPSCLLNNRILTLESIAFFLVHILSFNFHSTR